MSTSVYGGKRNLLLIRGSCIDFLFCAFVLMILEEYCRQHVIHHCRETYRCDVMLFWKDCMLQKICGVTFPPDTTKRPLSFACTCLRSRGITRCKNSSVSCSNTFFTGGLFSSRAACVPEHHSVEGFQLRVFQQLCSRIDCLFEVNIP